MLDEFLGGAEAKRAGCPELRRKFVSARRDILIVNVEGASGQSCLAPAKSEGPPCRMAQTSGVPTQTGEVIRAYLRYERHSRVLGRL